MAPPRASTIAQRGITPGGKGAEGLGVAPPLEKTRRHLLGHSYTHREIDEAGIVQLDCSLPS